MAVLRVFLLGLLMIGLGVGFRRQWLQVNWDRLKQDINWIPADAPDGLDFNRWLIGEPTTPSAPDEERPAANSL